MTDRPTMERGSPPGDDWPEVVAIEWWDSECMTSDSAWADLEQAREFAQRPHQPCKSVGLVLHRDDKTISIVKDLALYECDPPTKIPINSIKRIGRVHVEWE